MTCGQASQATNVKLVQRAGWTSFQMDTIWTNLKLDELVERPALPSPAHAGLTSS